jgi:predicted ATPase
MPTPRLRYIHIDGYRAFKRFEARLGPLEVLVGVNGSGKSTLFEFLQFLREGVNDQFPVENVSGSLGKDLFHRPGPDRFSWKVCVDMGFEGDYDIEYSADLTGSRGSLLINREEAFATSQEGSPHPIMEVRDRKGWFSNGPVPNELRQRVALRRPNKLALSDVTNPDLVPLTLLRDHLRSMTYYQATQMLSGHLRRSVPVQQEPCLSQDGSNLSAVLYYLWTEERGIFEQIESAMRVFVPGFKSLSVKLSGTPAEVMTFYTMRGSSAELSIADLSDGLLRLLCWTVISHVPQPAHLVCVDEPDLGLHPSVLPYLADMFRELATRTQVMVATHSSQFLKQFSLEEIAVMSLGEKGPRFLKPANSDVLRASLPHLEVGHQEQLHRSEELEKIS